MTNAAVVHQSPSYEEEARAVLDGYQDAWNRHDMKSLAELFEDDAHWVNIVGMHWPGREAIVRAHDAYHWTFFRTTRIRMADVQIRPIAPGVVVAVILLKVDAFTPPDGVTRPATDNCLSVILTQDGARWRIAHAHNTVVDPGAQRFDPVKTGWPDSGRIEGS
jgi:uncharacterized protein (TIGR02246 family)